jgi:AraC family transcriptional regulator
MQLRKIRQTRLCCDGSHHDHGVAMTTKQAAKGAPITTARAWQSYEARFARVIAHIHDHLDDEIDLNRLAEIACLSPHHWHRVYHACHGETIAATVKRLRLHRAAGDLANTGMAVADVARRSGYPSVASFTRVFRQAFGLPPARFRAEGGHLRFAPGTGATDGLMRTVELRDQPALTLVTITHRGSYMAIGRAFDRLFGRLGAMGRLAPDLRMIAIYEDDPTAVAEAALRSRAGVVVRERFPAEAPLEFVEIAAGPYAALRHRGPYAEMRAAYLWLYGTWLPRSGREAADLPVLEEYLNSPRDTAPADLLTDMLLPLRPIEGARP